MELAKASILKMMLLLTLEDMVKEKDQEVVRITNHLLYRSNNKVQAKGWGEDDGLEELAEA